MPTTPPMEQALVYINGVYFFYITTMGLFLLNKRKSAIVSGKVSPHYFKTYQGTLPEDLQVLGNHFNNQFQIPLYFMATTAFSLALGTTTPTFVILSILFVLSRFGHSWAQLCGNNVLRRAAFYFLGIFFMALMWVSLMWNVAQ